MRIRIDVPEDLSSPSAGHAHAANAGFAIYNYNTGSALIAYGLSAKQCLAAGILSPIVLVIMCILCGVSPASSLDITSWSLPSPCEADASGLQHSGLAEATTSLTL